MRGKSIYMIGLALLLAAVPARGQGSGVEVVPVRLQQVRDSVHIDLDIVLSDVRVKSAETVALTPRVVSDRRGNSLPAVSVKGRSSYKAYQRSVALHGPDMGAGIVVKGYGRRDTTVRYRHTMAYRPWMRGAGVEVQYVQERCGAGMITGVTPLADRLLLEKVWPPVEPVRPRLAFVRPEAEEVKSREIQAECRLDFVVNRTEINPSYMNNPRELARIRGIIDELAGDPSISVVGLEITGYASPEGSLANNRRLSEGRAGALRDYLASLYDFPASAYKVTFGGENWDGLVRALASYAMEGRDKVLAVIEATPADQTRKQRLMNLRGGAPYRDMLKNIYPALRTAVCTIDYRIAGFDVHDAVEVFATRPQNLSLNELYLVANTFEEGSWDFIEVFETAVRMYPDDTTANLNAAIAALHNGNIGAAERYIAKARGMDGRPEYVNAMGVLALLKGDTQAAERFFRQAAGALDAARHNLETMPGRQE